MRSTEHTEEDQCAGDDPIDGEWDKASGFDPLHKPSDHGESDKKAGDESDAECNPLLGLNGNLGLQ